MRFLLPALFLAAGCGLDLAGTGPAENASAGTPAPSANGADGGGALTDATLDAIPPATDGSAAFDAAPVPPDAPPDVVVTCSVYCGGNCVASCNDCNDKLACGNTCVPDCSTCSVGGVAKSFECFNCANFHPEGTCEDQNGYCFSGIYAPCACATLAGPSATACPSSQQVCLPGLVPTCHTCGEGTTVGQTCKNNKACQNDGGPPKCSG